MKDNKEFKKAVESALEDGRKSFCETVEIALMKKINEGYFPAIKFYLEKNDKRYHPRKVATVDSSVDSKNNEMFKALYSFILRKESFDNDKSTEEHQENIIKAMNAHGYFIEKGLSKSFYEDLKIDIEDPVFKHFRGF
jgi:hypothetical protein